MPATTLPQVCDIPVSRPGLETGEDGLWGLRPHLWYDPTAVAGAWGQLLDGASALDGRSTYLYDLADVGRQVLFQRLCVKSDPGFRMESAGYLYVIEDVGRQRATPRCPLATDSWHHA